MRGNLKRTSTGRFALAGGGKLLGNLLDRHSNHLLSGLPGRSIERDPDSEFPRRLSPDSDSHRDILLKFYTDTRDPSTKFLESSPSKR